MKHYAGLDVSVKETSICIVDETGKVCRELKVASHPEDLLRVLQDPAWNLVRVGLEAGPLSLWLFNGLAEAGVPALCIETRRAKAYLKAQINKTDRNDARGIAQMMRVNLFRPVHVKTLASQKRRALLTARKLLQAEEAAVLDRCSARQLNACIGRNGGMAAAEQRNARLNQRALLQSWRLTSEGRIEKQGQGGKTVSAGSSCLDLATFSAGGSAQPSNSRSRAM
jgi:transposase